MNILNIILLFLSSLMTDSDALKNYENILKDENNRFIEFNVIDLHDDMFNYYIWQLHTNIDEMKKKDEDFYIYYETLFFGAYDLFNYNKFFQVSKTCPCPKISQAVFKYICKNNEVCLIWILPSISLFDEIMTNDKSALYNYVNDYKNKKLINLAINLNKV